MNAFIECFWVAFKLGLIAFGGPVAHIGYFRACYVERLGWLSEERFAELMAVTQFLPGPGSSQLGAAIGYERGGWLGGFGAWLGFTLPSALVLVAFALGMDSLSEHAGTGWIQGLLIAAVAVVFIAVVGMHKALCPTWREMLFALGGLAALYFFRALWLQPLVIFAGGIIGVYLFRETKTTGLTSASSNTQNLRGFAPLLPMALLMAALLSIPLFTSPSSDAGVLGGILRAGSLVFGGGHVVLPLLESSTVGVGRLDSQTFLAGYGATQAVPGPVFTFGAFLGAKTNLFGNPALGALCGLVAVFLPGMILLAGVLPVWNRLKSFPWAQAAIKGANATVVGVLAYALVWMLETEVHTLPHFLFLAILIALLHKKLLPVWLLVIGSGVLGGFLC